MITLNPPIPEVPATLETFSNLLALLNDPAASAARLSELKTASAGLQKSATDQRAAAAAFSVAASDHKALIEKREAESADRLAADRSAFDTECSRRSAELSAREANVKELQATAADDAKAAASARANFEKKLAIIKSAM
jgi:hypothetical protein